MRQIEAADPAGSVWLSANAGSGKTRVLIDRVARLLLGGTEPQRILCLTYTKAAATEMQNRLFARLGGWTMLPDAPLRDELGKLGIEGAMTEAMLRQARRLFAKAIDTPGGLKIQTIHSFCAGLLRRFPIEARISPNFTELDDRSARMLREEIIDQIASGPDARVLDAVAGLVSGMEFGPLAAEIGRNSDAFFRPVDLDTCLDLFGLPPGFDEGALLSEVFLGGEEALFA
ncbi:MAG: UvrD-helicase domain-containing protein, partial [Rhodobacteraceae bacterium]|nr:UvrD-helicase domain-containing protein [Paracoccaceae bacterium]